MRQALSLLVALVLACAPLVLASCSHKTTPSEKAAAGPDTAAKAKALEAAGMAKKWTQNPSAAKGASK